MTTEQINFLKKELSDYIFDISGEAQDALGFDSIYSMTFKAVDIDKFLNYLTNNLSIPTSYSAWEVMGEVEELVSNSFGNVIGLEKC